MPHNKLKSALSTVDWNANISVFLKDKSVCDNMAKCNLRLAIWAKQFENADKGNPALAFIREMQVSGHHVVALTSLALYKPAAAAMRTMLEAALYYTYFRTHPSELATLARKSKFVIYKEDLLDYHKMHTADFRKSQEQFGLVGNCKEWYKKISSIVHGQIPGKWVEHKSLADTKHVKSTLSIVVKSFSDGEEIVHQLFLCTSGRELWEDFATAAKRKLLLGIRGNIKAALGLDSA